MRICRALLIVSEGNYPGRLRGPMQSASLNLSEFVDGCSESINRGVRLSEALLFARDELKNDEEMHSVSASMYALQTAIN